MAGGGQIWACGSVAEVCLRERKHDARTCLAEAAGAGKAARGDWQSRGGGGIRAGPITSGLILRAGCDIREVRRTVRREVVEVVFTSCPHFLLEERAAQVDLTRKA